MEDRRRYYIFLVPIFLPVRLVSIFLRKSPAIMLILRSFRDKCESPWYARRFLLALLTFSFLGKVILRLVILRDSDYWDSGYSFYFSTADTYLKTGSMCAGDPADGAYFAFRPPLFPLFIATVCRLTNYSADAFVVCEALLSTATVALVYWMTAKIARSSAALAAAALYAFYPYAFWHDTQLQENVLYTALALAGAAALMTAMERQTWRRFFLAGAVTGAAILTRTAHTTTALFLLLAVVFAFRRQPRRVQPGVCLSASARE